MRIAVNTRLLLKNKLEGIGYFTHETMQRITAAHPEHEFIFIFDRAWDEMFIYNSNVTPVKIGPQSRHPLLWYLWFEISIPRILRKVKADVFLSHDGYLSIKSKVPTHMVIHDLAYKHHPKHVGGPVRRYYQKYVPRFLKRADRIATVSEASALDINSSYNIAMEDMDIVYCATKDTLGPLSDSEVQATRIQYSDGKPYFLFIGTMQPRKNLERLLQAFDEFKKSQDTDIQLLVAGREGWETGTIFNTYNEMTHKDSVKMLGYVQESELAKINGSALALCYPSLFEGFGIPILEAMSCGIPVLTSNISSMPEVSGDAALLIDPYSIEDISEGMRKLAADEDYRKALISKGLLRSKMFNWEDTSEKLWKSIIKLPLFNEGK